MVRISKSILFTMAACLTSLLSKSALAGNLSIYENETGSEVTGNTVTYTWADAGGESGALIEKRFAVANQGVKELDICVKKVELTPLQEDVAHSFCFAGYCFSPRTFESPYSETLAAGASDKGMESGLKASYSFDKHVHAPGVDRVAYVFFDKADPKDSAVVYVEYSTISLATGIAPRSRPGQSHRKPGRLDWGHGLTDLIGRWIHP